MPVTRPSGYLSRVLEIVVVEKKISAQQYQKKKSRLLISIFVETMVCSSVRGKGFEVSLTVYELFIKMVLVMKKSSFTGKHGVNNEVVNVNELLF